MIQQTASFLIPHGTSAPSQTRRSTVFQSAGRAEAAKTTVEDISSMSVKEIKSELVALRVSIDDVFEKQELVRRLYQARQKQPKEPRNAEKASSKQMEAPLFFTSADSDVRVPAVNGGGISITASDRPFASIQIQIPNNDKPLNLLLDTACSGVVLRPSVVEEYGLPSMKTPVPTMGASGTAAANGLTQLNRFQLADQMFGPLPAAIQDIGGLPRALDGIIGLTFLSQFEAVDLDFQKGSLRLHKSSPLPALDLQVVSEAPMALLPRLGVYTTDVFVGGKGPVKMLVDTGAQSTYMNWKGVSDLTLSRDSKFVVPCPTPMGAMGSDNVAMQLTHRINVSSKIELGTSSESTGLKLKDDRLAIDIGNIGILDSLSSDNVGGILGIDVLMRCDAVRLTFKGERYIQLLKQT